MRMKMYCSTCDVEGEFDVPLFITPGVAMVAQVQCPFCSNQLDTEVVDVEPAVDAVDDVDFGDENDPDET